MRRLVIPILALIIATTVVVTHAQRTLADPRDFHITNANASLSVTEIWIDVTGPGDYSTELLMGNPLAPGDGGTVRFNQIDAGQCIYDLLVKFEDGSSREFTGLDLCSTTEVTVS